MLDLVWNFSASVGGGPAVAASVKPAIGAVDKVVVAVTNDGADVNVELQPGGAGKVVLLFAQSSLADPKVTVKLKDDATTPNVTSGMPLQYPLLLAGGALGLLKGPPKTAILNFATGTGTETTTVELMVARTI